MPQTIRNPIEWSGAQIVNAGHAIASARKSLDHVSDTVHSPAPAVRKISIADVRESLAKGFDDFEAYRRRVIFLCTTYALIGVVLARIAFGADLVPLLFPLASGFAIVGPLAAVGLYEMSRRREQGAAPGLGASLTCWDRHLGSMGLLVLVLTVFELLWGRASLVVFAVFFDTGMPSTASVLQAVFNPRNWQFLAVYTVVGGVFAALVFCSTAVSIPMILDRDTDAVTAALTSFGVVLQNMAALLFWGALVVVLTLLALWPWALGIFVVGPWLGHATWHAYREAVGWDS